MCTLLRDTTKLGKRFGKAPVVDKSIKCLFVIPPQANDGSVLSSMLIFEQGIFDFNSGCFAKAMKVLFV